MAARSGPRFEASLRRATADEVEVFYQSAETATHSDELLLAYLVELDDLG